MSNELSREEVSKGLKKLWQRSFPPPGVLWRSEWRKWLQSLDIHYNNQEEAIRNAMKTLKVFIPHPNNLNDCITACVKTQDSRQTRIHAAYWELKLKGSAKQ